MIDYRAGNWGFHVAVLNWSGSLVPKALVMAVPNAVVTFVIATLWRNSEWEGDDFQPADETAQGFHEDTAKVALGVIATFTSVLTVILYRRSSIGYNRWWEGGTLIQKTRGEWFNAYSSIMAFTSTKPELQEQVEGYQRLLARLMSLLMCCGLQQVSPNRERPFEIIDLSGIEPESMDFLNSAPDKVEIILQWIQRSMILHMQTGVLPAPPPILSRAFQEVSRGIVNLQNARKIADFPYPYPLAQISMLLQILHWFALPWGLALAMPRVWGALFSFFSVGTLWAIHFNAIELEFPFGTRVNDLPMMEFQQEWNKSLYTLLDRRATRPPVFTYDPLASQVQDVKVVMSDASDLYVPRHTHVQIKGVSKIRLAERKAIIEKSNRNSTETQDSQRNKSIASEGFTKDTVTSIAPPGTNSAPVAPQPPPVPTAAQPGSTAASSSSTGSAPQPSSSSSAIQVSIHPPGSAPSAPQPSSGVTASQLSSGATAEPGTLSVTDGPAIPATSSPGLQFPLR